MWNPKGNWGGNSKDNDFFLIQMTFFVFRKCSSMMINIIYLHIDIHLIPRIQLISVVWVKSSKIWVIWVGVYILIYLEIPPKKCHVVLQGAKDLIIGTA